MNFAPIFIVFLRILVPFSIFHNALLGVFLCIILDTFDLPILRFLGSQDILEKVDYHNIDKFLDFYYLFFLFLISFNWQEDLARKTSIFLFLHRCIGVFAFTLTKKRMALFLFPNLFENFFLFYLIAKTISPTFHLESLSQLFFVFLIAGIPKIFQEYVLHYLKQTPAEFLKNYTPLYFKESTITDWLKNLVK